MIVGLYLVESGLFLQFVPECSNIFQFDQMYVKLISEYCL